MLGKILHVNLLVAMNDFTMGNNISKMSFGPVNLLKTKTVTKQNNYIRKMHFYNHNQMQKSAP